MSAYVELYIGKKYLSTRDARAVEEYLLKISNQQKKQESFMKIQCHLLDSISQNKTEKLATATETQMN